MRPSAIQPDHRRTVTIGAIIALHAAAISMLANPDVIRLPQQKSKSFTWLELEPLQNDAEPILIPKASVTAPFKYPAPFEQPVKVPPAALTPEASLTSAPASDLGALRSYVWCGRLDDGKSPDPTKPCDKLRLNLHDGEVPNRAPTDAERAIIKGFERDKAVADAPVLLPCVSGGAVSIACVAKAAVTGKVEMSSYAHADPSLKCDPRFAGAEECRRNYSLHSFSPRRR